MVSNVFFAWVNQSLWKSTLDVAKFFCLMERLRVAPFRSKHFIFHKQVYLFPRAAWAISTVVALMDSEGLIMSEQAATRCCFLGKTFLQCYVWLAHNAATLAKPRFRLRPKLHVFHHEMDRVSRWRLNPKTTACFSDEDFVGRMCNIAQSVGHQGILKSFVSRYVGSTFSVWKTTFV